MPRPRLRRERVEVVGPHISPDKHPAGLGQAGTRSPLHYAHWGSSSSASGNIVPVAAARSSFCRVRNSAERISSRRSRSASAELRLVAADLGKDLRLVRTGGSPDGFTLAPAGELLTEGSRFALVPVVDLGHLAVDPAGLGLVHLASRVLDVISCWSCSAVASAAFAAARRSASTSA